MRLSEHLTRSWLAFGLSVLLLILCSFFPDSRLWALNRLGYLSTFHLVAYPLIAIGFALGLIGLTRTAGAAISGRAYGGLVAGFGGAALAAFVLARSRMHFLGDGFLQLSLLAAEHPVIKLRNFGGEMVPYVLSHLLGSGEAAVLLAYQLVSYAAGMVFIAMSALAARRLYASRLDALLFVLALCTGGYAVLFFGYVENYALFVLLVGAYCLIGMFVADGALARSWLLVTQAACLVFHVFGILLLPVTLYLLLDDSSVGRRFRKLSPMARWSLIVFGVVASGIALIASYHTGYMLRFTMVPLTDGPYAVDDYWLFSGAHLLDFANLLFLLCPGLLVGLSVLMPAGGRTPKRTRRSRFLMVVSLVALGAVFLIDPKLGMPRDWDLFSFAGIPLVLLVADSLLVRATAGHRSAVALMVASALLLLAIRVSVLATPSAALRQIHAYLYLDPVKNHNVWPVLAKYYESNGDSEAARESEQEREKLLPEETWLRAAREAGRKGDHQRALRLTLRAAPRYRGMETFHANYGSALLNLGRADEAFEELRIAQTLNPYSAIVLANLGMIYLNRGEPDKAESYWRTVLEREPYSGLAVYGLTAINSRRNDLAALPDLLDRGSKVSQMRADFFEMIAAAALRGRDYPLAGRALEAGRTHGVSEATIDTLRTRHPSLGPYLEAKAGRSE